MTNSYEQKLEARRERLAARAAKKRVEAGAARSQSKRMADAIPFGQPILVGHYSEGRDRRYRERMQNLMFKGCALDDYADDLDRRAAAVGSAGISSDDPEAVTKLLEKIESAKASQEAMKAVNKVVRKRVPESEKQRLLMDMGYDAGQAAELLKPDFAGRVGFPSYALQNNNANIRRMEKRVEELRAMDQAEEVEREAAPGVIYREDPDANRVQLVFDGKPSAEIRAILKSRGLRWAPSVGAWQRQLNNAGRYAVQAAIEAINDQGLL